MVQLGESVVAFNENTNCCAFKYHETIETSWTPAEGGAGGGGIGGEGGAGVEGGGEGDGDGGKEGGNGGGGGRGGGGGNGGGVTTHVLSMDTHPDSLSHSAPTGKSAHVFAAGGEGGAGGVPGGTFSNSCT